jgi:hypothetical protein
MPVESNKEVPYTVFINWAPATSYLDASMTNATLP